MYSVVGTMMLKPASPRRPPALARTASATGPAEVASLPWCAASPASRSCGPATPFDGTARGRAVPSGEPESRPAAGLHRTAAGGAASTKVSISTGSTRRTRSCRCPTTMAGLRHTGFTERLPASRHPGIRRRIDSSTASIPHGWNRGCTRHVLPETPMNSVVFRRIRAIAAGSLPADATEISSRQADSRSAVAVAAAGADTKS